jgi:hypothetical protein
MESPEETPCTSCGQRPAVHFMSSFGSGPQRQQALCDVCFEAKAPQSVKDETALLGSADCSYCGAKPVLRVGTIDSILGEPVDRFACHSCFQEHHRFMLERLGTMDAELMELDNATQMEALRQLSDETEAHMRQWVKQGDN